MTAKPCLMFVAVVTGWAALALRGQEASDPAPARAESGQTLVIPESVLDTCDVFHVMPGEDGQIVCVSDAPLRRLVATCNRVVGFVAVPFEFEAGQKMIASGAFRIPVPSLSTGNTDQDDQLRGPMMMNAAAHPEATFVISDATPARQVSADKEFVTFQFSVRGKLTLLGVSKDVEWPVTVTRMPVDFKRTFMRYPGEFVSLRTRVELTPEEFGWKRPRFLSKDVIGEKVTIDIALFLNEIPPYNALDPEIPVPVRTQELWFLTLARDLNQPEKAYAYARQQLASQPDNATLHNRLAWAIVAEPGVRKRNLDLALEAAQRANALTESKKAAFLDTLARVYYERGDLKSALETARKAVANLAGVDPMTAGPIQQSLAKYEAESKAAAPAGNASSSEAQDTKSSDSSSAKAGGT